MKNQQHDALKEEIKKISFTYLHLFICVVVILLHVHEIFLKDFYSENKNKLLSVS